MMPVSWLAWFVVHYPGLTPGALIVEPLMFAFLLDRLLPAPRLFRIGRHS